MAAIQGTTSMRQRNISDEQQRSAPHNIQLRNHLKLSLPCILFVIHFTLLPQPMASRADLHQVSLHQPHPNPFEVVVHWPTSCSLPSACNVQACDSSSTLQAWSLLFPPQPYLTGLGLPTIKRQHTLSAIARSPIHYSIAVALSNCNYAG